MSALERDELDRLLSDTKTELFAQKRRARVELEALQEVKCPPPCHSQLRNKIPAMNSTKSLSCFSGWRSRPCGAEVGGDVRGAAEGCRGRALPEEQVFITGGGAKAGQGADEGGEQPVLHTNQLFATASFGNLIISFFSPVSFKNKRLGSFRFLWNRSSRRQRAGRRSCRWR